MKRSPVKFLFLLVMGVLMNLLTMIFAAVPMRAVRQAYGRVPYWTGHAVAGAGLIALSLMPSVASAVPWLLIVSLMYVLITVAVGSYSEVEEHVDSVFMGGLLSLAITAGVAFAGLSVWLYRTKADLVAVAKSYVNQLSETGLLMGPQSAVNVGFNADAAVQFVPSVLTVMIILALASALIWERRAYLWFRLPHHGRPRFDLTAFRVPDVFVWVTMLAILGAFLQHGRPWLETLSHNALNVLLVLYFFQGLGVVARFFQVIKLSPFWQGFWYIMIVFQLLLLVSVLGFVDFWMDFRERLVKKTTEVKKSF